jgi:hypothetical protein
VAEFGINGGVFIQLPLLLVTVTGAYLLARVWVRPGPAAVTALAFGINQAVIGYALMLHFSIAVTGAIVWAFYAYVRSDHLREPRWCIAVGVALAGLLLSRSMAVAYAVPLLLVFLADVALHARRRRPRWATIALSAGVLLLLAGPWWVVSGHTALHYLSSAGYSQTSGLSSQTGGLGPSSVYQHIVWELNPLAWPQCIALGVAVLACLWRIARYRSRLRYGPLWLLPVWILLSVLVLSSSGNDGTAFGLPLVGMAIVTCGAVLGQRLGSSFQKHWAAVTVVAVGVVLLFGVVAEGTGGISLWWNGPPYRAQVLVAGGSRDTNLEALATHVARIIGNEPTLEGFGDPLLNGNALTWTTRRERADLIEVPDSTDGTKGAIALLGRAKFLISGSSYAQYPPLVDGPALEASAVARKFRPVRTWVFGSGRLRTALIVWKRSTRPLPSDFFAPRYVRVLKPSSGAVMRGNQYLAAHIAGRAGLPTDVTKVEFLATGDGRSNVPIATGVNLGFAWLGAWKTSQVADGRYVITCVALDGSHSTRSPGIAVQIEN